MKQYTIKFTTTDEFDPVLVEWGRMHKKDGITSLKLSLGKYITALIGSKYIQDLDVSYKTVKPVKK